MRAAPRARCSRPARRGTQPVLIPARRQRLRDLLGPRARARVDDRRARRRVAQRRTISGRFSCGAGRATANDEVRPVEARRHPQRVAQPEPRARCRPPPAASRWPWTPSASARPRSARRRPAGSSRAGSRGPTARRSAPRRRRTGRPRAPRMRSTNPGDEKRSGATYRSRSRPPSAASIAARLVAESCCELTSATVPAPARLQRLDLVLHQRDERRDDDRQVVADQRGQLVAERLARAGRHHDERVAPASAASHASRCPGRKPGKPKRSCRDCSRFTRPGYRRRQRIRAVWKRVVT